MKTIWYLFLVFINVWFWLPALWWMITSNEIIKIIADFWGYG